MAAITETEYRVFQAAQKAMKAFEGLLVQRFKDWVAAEDTSLDLDALLAADPNVYFEVDVNAALTDTAYTVRIIRDEGSRQLGLYARRVPVAFLLGYSESDEYIQHFLSQSS